MVRQLLPVHSRLALRPLLPEVESVHDARVSGAAFNSPCRWYLTIVSLVAYIFTKISVTCSPAADSCMRSVLGWDYLTTSILLVVATGIYTITGGPKAVIYTDLFQSFVLLTGRSLTQSGSITRWLPRTARGPAPRTFFHMIKPASDPVYPWVGTIFGTMILGVWYWCTDQSIVQKTLSAKDLENARKGSFSVRA